MKLHFWLPFLLSLSLAASGCGGTAKQANTLIYGRGGDANTLDPINTDIGESVTVMVNIYDTLVTYDDETMDLAPGLATSWEHSDDGLEWTFHLREGVKFHDGTPFDSAAVVFTFERYLQDKHPHRHDDARPYLANFQGIESVTAPDARTAVFHLKEPSAVFLQNMCMFPASIISPAAAVKLGKWFGTSPVGTGPFKFVSWKRDQQLALAAFDAHWRGRPKVDRVIFLPVAKSATRVQMLRKGEIHIADNLPPDELDALLKVPGIVSQEQVGINVGYLTMQMEKPPLNLLKVRQAIAHAIDKRGLIDVAYSGQAQPAVNMVPPAMFAHHDDLADRPFDLAKAKRLMQEAASEAGFDLPVKLSLNVMSDPRPYMQQPTQTASFIKDSLAEIGIEVSVVSKGISEHFAHLMAGRHELGLAGWSSDNFDPDNFLYSLLDIDNINENGNNLSRYRNDEVHRLLKAGQRELDPEQRLPMYLRVQELVFEDVPVVPLVHTRVRIAQRDNLKGYKLHPSSLVRLRLAYFEGAK
jgi:peptide/nickel transport system substrate-binding protein